MPDSLQKMEDAMDLDRTDKLFNSAVGRSDAHNKEKYGEDDLKKMRTVIGFGNLHINSAKVKLSVVRMKGYQNSVALMKQAIDRKIRKNNKYGRKTD